MGCVLASDLIITNRIWAHRTAATNWAVTGAARFYLSPTFFSGFHPAAKMSYLLTKSASPFACPPPAHCLTHGVTHTTPLTATILTKNSAPLLREVLAALEWCSEVVVLDTGSSDATLTIAAEFANVSL